MRYWCVNQNQTFRQEIEGGYLWSPHRENVLRMARGISKGECGG
jgi:hypothetical protein